MRRISRMILVTAGYNFRMWKKNMRVIAAFLMAFILCFMLTDKLVLFAGEQETTMQLVEPFIWTFGDGNSILLGSMLFLLLFGDLPFITTATPFFLIRENRKIWIAGQFLYIVGACVCYLMFILGSTGILCMKYVASLLLAVLLLISLVACGQEAPQAPATLGQALLQDFQTRVKDSPQADLETLAQGLLDQEDLEFQGAVTPVEPGLLMGFGNETIQGFSQGVMFAPVISTIPFVGYLFRLE